VERVTCYLLIETMPLWTNWQSRFSQKEECSRFDSEQGYQTLKGYMMYKVIGKEETFKVLTLAEAMNVAKSMNEFVTIKGSDFELCGMFGVDAVEDATLPNGDSYSWTMRRDENHRSWRKKIG